MKFIYAGRLENIKGTHILLEGWKKFSNLNSTLTICGCGDLERWSKEYIRTNKLTNIEMKGFLSNIVVKQLIGNSDALLIPSQCYEGFPMTILEAFSLGIPVIVGNIGNAGSLVENRITGLKFIYDSADDLARCLTEFCLLSDINWKVNIDKTYKRFMPENNYLQLLQIYKKLKNIK